MISITDQDGLIRYVLDTASDSIFMWEVVV